MQNQYTSYVIWVEGIWRREMLKVKIIVVGKMVAGESQRCGKHCGQ